MIEKFADEEKLAEIDKLEKLKTRVLKYIMFKKRTEKEVRTKFESEDQDLLEQTIEILKDLGYINDVVYIERFIDESLLLKNLSMYELKYKLYGKGIDKSLIEDYFSQNLDTLLEYERKSAENLYNKKIRTMEHMDIIMYLKKKGYKEESIKSLGE